MFTLTKSQNKFMELFKNSRENLFLLGAAGTGKSHCINLIKNSEEFKTGKILLTSSTGTSALNIGGSTLHSALGIGLANDSIPGLIKKISFNKKAKKRIQHCSSIIIDEISMISGETFDKVVGVVSFFRKKMPRFILIGDPCQLSPVFKDDSSYIFQSDSFKKLEFKKVVLTEVVRQSDKAFIDALAKIRTGDCSDIGLFDSRISRTIPDGAIVVFCKNVDVDRFNMKKLSELKTPSRTFQSNDVGNEYQLESLDRNCLAPKRLELKVGAQVMLLKNLDVDDGLVNGSIGVVVDLKSNKPKVKFSSGTVELNKEKWELTEDVVDANGVMKKKVVAFREQIPLKLAWGSTVHKTQSITCDKIHLDLDGCWGHGQAYTALSRARTLEGLTLSSISPSMVKVDKEVIEFYKNIKSDD